MSPLEERYRRLLRWYPAEHRRAHEEEMLGVLLEAAGPDRTRPSGRDALDLVRGGLAIRLRHAPASLARAGWHDAAALLSVLLPLTLLAEVARYALRVALVFPELRDGAAHGASWAYMLNSAPSHLLWGIVAVAALAGARRVTVAGALAALGAECAADAIYAYAGGPYMTPMLLGLAAVAALLAGPGPARGRTLLGRGGLGAVVVLLALAAGLKAAALGEAFGTGVNSGLTLVPVAVVVVGLLARSAAGRRAVVVLVAALYPLIAPWFLADYPVYVEDPLLRFAVSVVAVPPAVGLAALAVTAAAERVARAVARRAE